MARRCARTRGCCETVAVISDLQHHVYNWWLQLVEWTCWVVGLISAHIVVPRVEKSVHWFGEWSCATFSFLKLRHVHPLSTHGLKELRRNTVQRYCNHSEKLSFPLLPCSYASQECISLSRTVPTRHVHDLSIH